jgi:flagellar biosynthesis protein FlhB
MSEHKSEKASEYKLKEARKKGQVNKSIELNGMVIVLFSIFYLYLFSHNMGHDITQLTQDFLSGIGSTKHHMIIEAREFIWSVFGVLLPFLLTLVVISTVVNLLQVGFVVSFEPLAPKFEKMNPVKGFKKLFSKKNLFEFFKQIIKLALIVMILSTISYAILDALFSAALTNTRWTLGFALSTEALKVAFYIILTSIPLVFLDVAFTRWDFRKQMMMSQREVKEEHKKKEGNPEVKSKRKQQQKELAKKLLALTNVKNADVIINNPTHIAVALKFDPNTMIAPEVIVSGKGFIGQYIRKLGAKHQVKQIVDIPLARGLFNDVEIGQPVPKVYFSALSKIYRKILGMDVKNNG